MTAITLHQTSSRPDSCRRHGPQPFGIIAAAKPEAEHPWNGRHINGRDAAHLVDPGYQCGRAERRQSLQRAFSPPAPGHRADAGPGLWLGLPDHRAFYRWPPGRRAALLAGTGLECSARQPRELYRWCAGGLHGLPHRLQQRPSVPARVRQYRRRRARALSHCAARVLARHHRRRLQLCLGAGFRLAVVLCRRDFCRAALHRDDLLWRQGPGKSGAARIAGPRHRAGLRGLVQHQRRPAAGTPSWPSRGLPRPRPP